MTQSSGNIQETKLNPDVWERYAWVWTALHFAMIVIPTVLTLLDSSITTNARWQMVGYVSVLVVLALWYFAYSLRRWGDGRWKLWPALVYAGGSILIWYQLVSISTAYYILLFSLFGQIYSFLPIWFAVLFAIILTMLIGFASMDGQWSFTADTLGTWIFMGTSFLGTLFALWIHRIIQQSALRRGIIEELQAAQAELAAAERRSGMLAERQRLARDIHDTLAQGFTSIVMHLEAAEQALPSETDTVQHHIDQARSTARSSLGEARRVLGDLRPEFLEKDPLPRAIERTVETWSQQTGIETSITTTGDIIALHPELDVTLLRATQEALANIRKHANATSVSVTLSYIEDVIVLDVEDNGDGVQLNGSSADFRKGGYGLKGMRERAAQFGGSVQIESEPGVGTTLAVVIPLQMNQDPQ